MTSVRNPSCETVRSGNTQRNNAFGHLNRSPRRPSSEIAGSQAGLSPPRRAGSSLGKPETVQVPKTELPDFGSVRRSAPPIGHNSANTEGSLEDLKLLRNILVGPSKQQMETRLEELISILEEREADLVKREEAMNLVVTQLERRLADTMMQAELKQHRVMTEIGNAVSSLGNEIAAMGGKLRS